MATEAMTATPNLIIPVSGGKLIDQINARRVMMKDPNHYQILGRMWRLIFDPFGMSRPTGLDHPVFRINELNWEGEGKNCAPVLAISRNDRELLILPPVPPLAEVCAPDAHNNMEDWVPTDLPGWQTPRGTPGIIGKMPRRYQQRYSDLTTKFIPDTLPEPDFRNPDCFFVIQPVSQMYVQLSGASQPGLVEPITGNDGRQMAFLVNPRTREARFIGGAIRMTTRLYTLPEGATP